MGLTFQMLHFSLVTVYFPMTWAYYFGNVPGNNLQKTPFKKINRYPPCKKNKRNILKENMPSGAAWITKEPFTRTPGALNHQNQPKIWPKK